MKSLNYFGPLLENLSWRSGATRLDGLVREASLKQTNPSQRSMYRHGGTLNFTNISNYFFVIFFWFGRLVSKSGRSFKPFLFTELAASRCVQLCLMIILKVRIKNRRRTMFTNVPIRVFVFVRNGTTDIGCLLAAKPVCFFPSSSALLSLPCLDELR